MLFAELLNGIVIETKTTTWTGGFFYSDQPPRCTISRNPPPMLNKLATIQIIGIAAGIARVACAILHILGHLLAFLVTLDEGHLYHAAKGGCEFLRGCLEAIPFVGRNFANWYYVNGNWWIIKIYNPEIPDRLDKQVNFWADLKQSRPNAYVVGY